MSYTIHRDGNYFSTTANIERPGLLRAHWGDEIIAVASKQEAETIVAMLEDYPSAYVLAHGQHSPPGYKVSESKASVMSLHDAMCALVLQYDFNADGSRKVAGAYL